MARRSNCERICLHLHTVKPGPDVRLSKFINLCGCEIGDETKIGAFAEIQKNATVVSKDVPPYAIVAGDPARILRYVTQGKIQI